MTINNEQIKQMYEELDMSPEEIATSEGYEIEAVKAALIAVSSQYRGALSNGVNTSSKHPHEYISDEEERTLFDAYKWIALNGEQEGVRAKVIRDLIAEKRGRNDIAKVVKGTQVNVVLINDSIRKAREAIKRIKDLSSKKPVTLEIAA
jgi:hypothetical protein